MKIKSTLLAALSLMLFGCTDNTNQPAVTAPVVEEKPVMVAGATESPAEATPAPQPDKWAEAKEKSARAWDATREAGSSTWEATRESSAEAWDATREKSGEAWQATKQTSSELWDKTRSASGELWEATKDTGETAWEATKEGTRKVGDTIDDRLSGDSTKTQ